MSGGQHTQSDIEGAEQLRCGCRLGYIRWGCTLAQPGECD